MRADRRRLVRGPCERFCAGSQIRGAQFVVAPINDQKALHAVLVELESDKAAQPMRLLNARKEVSQNVSVSSLLKEVTELLFEQSQRHIRLARSVQSARFRDIEALLTASGYEVPLAADEHR